MYEGFGYGKGGQAKGDTYERVVGHEERERNTRWSGRDEIAIRTHYSCPFNQPVKLYGERYVEQQHDAQVDAREFTRTTMTHASPHPPPPAHHLSFHVKTTHGRKECHTQAEGRLQTLREYCGWQGYSGLSAAAPEVFVGEPGAPPSGQNRTAEELTYSPP